MRRAHGLYLLLIAVAMMTAAGSAAVNFDAATTSNAVAAPTAAAGACDATAGADQYQAPEGTNSCCISQCYNDKGCDRICGKGNGTCVQVNSCCRECFCNAT